tara:strand:+ start:952 stop:1314 length:363 start_codon:yes stop_codon:yes gene_type:complete
MKKGSILVLCEDDRGTSFLLFDVANRVVYNDIIEPDRACELYALFPIRLTITNVESHSTPRGEVVFRRFQSAHVSVLHDRQCAVDFGEEVLTNGPFSPLRHLRVRMEGLQLANETWRSWV